MGHHSSRGVSKASKTSLQISFQCDGKQRREFVTCDPTPTAIKQWEAKRLVILEEIPQGRFKYAKWFPWSKQVSRTEPMLDLRIADLLRNWLKAMEPRIQRTTFRKYRQITESILIPKFGLEIASEVTAHQITQWRTECQRLTRKTFSNYLSPLRLAYQYAVDECKLGISNPLAAYKVKPWRRDKERPKEDPDPKELVTALPYAQRVLLPFVLFNVWSGLRIEGMLELRWSDLDLVGALVRVQRARVRKVIKGTKTPSSNRSVTLFPDARRAIELVRPLSYLKGENVFMCARTGKPWLEDALRMAWQRACEPAYVIAHPGTFATRLLLEC